MPRFVLVFEPLAGAILAYQHAAALRHADETEWRVQALLGEGRSGRAWLWTAVGNDPVRFHIDASGSAEAAKLFGDLASETVIVCDRYSAYKRLARLLRGHGRAGVLLGAHAAGLHPLSARGGSPRCIRAAMHPA